MVSTNKIDPVLIVGAGPSGLMAALILSRLNIPIRIIEKNLSKSIYSRAIGVQIRTLEIFSSLGILQDLMKKGIVIDNFQINTENAVPIDLDPKLYFSQFKRPAIVDQAYTEEVLEHALNSKKISVERGVELIDFKNTQENIEAVLKQQSGDLSTFNFSYLIGADGAHSSTRKKMSNSFLGKTYEDAFILADVELNTKLSERLFRIYFKEKKFLALIPMFGKNHFRLISVRPNERSKKAAEPDQAEFQSLLDQLVPFSAKIKNVGWVSRFFVQCRSASHYQEGRVFLVGDSAHIHSPAGGQGMNTGLQDALNLCYKVALVLRGNAHPSLLSTYHQERKPVGDFLIKYTDRMFRFMVHGSIFARLFRKLVLPKILSFKSYQSRLLRIISQTAIRYAHGCMCQEKHPLVLPGVSIGARVPNWVLIGSDVQKTDIHSIVQGEFFSLLLFFPPSVDKPNCESIMRKAEYLCHSYQVKIIPVFASDYDAEKIISNKEYYLLSEHNFFKAQEDIFFMMIRPDHHLFCIGGIDELEHLKDNLARFLIRKKV
ncbi:MAG: FAD-dependent monooxygenase [Myxococcales bacterium]|nr:FAD-dependent monooxygenase [Myxococcales bacterium]USN51524.1 MAG: FAD-dependent monooxygenase [Myxococcales bacterium]